MLLSTWSRGWGICLLFWSYPGAFDGLICPHPREFAILKKKMLMPGGWPWGDGHWWNWLMHNHGNTYHRCPQPYESSSNKDHWTCCTILPRLLRSLHFFVQDAGPSHNALLQYAASSRSNQSCPLFLGRDCTGRSRCEDIVCQLSTLPEEWLP